MNDLKETIRILKNIRELLLNSNFKGKLALPVAESIRFLDNFISTSEQQLDSIKEGKSV
jgi:hypothetical protein